MIALCDLSSPVIESVIRCLGYLNDDVRVAYMVDEKTSTINMSYAG